MNIIIKTSKLIEKYMALIALLVAMLSLFSPKNFLFLKMDWINLFLMFIMFQMGLVLKFDDFKLVLTNPKDILIGTVSQFSIMPLLAYFLGMIFNLPIDLLTGLILVGACPGGTASNVITYLSKGDLALSVGVTAVNTLLAPILTPFIVYLFLHTSIKIDIAGLFIAIINVVIMPIIFGIIVNKFLNKYLDNFKQIMPSLSIIAISIIIATVVSHNSEKILNTGLIIFVAVILHNVLGYIAGYMVAKLAKMDIKKKKAISIEVGMQNSGLATSLAATSFPSLALATLPGAIFSVWHNISGAILAWYYSNKIQDNKENTTK